MNSVDEMMKLLDTVSHVKLHPTVLITGVAGATGSICAEVLLELGYEVVGLDNFYHGTEYNISGFRGHEKFNFFEVDITDYEALKEVFESFDFMYCIHCAAYVTTFNFYEKVQETYWNNVVGTEFVLSMCAAYMVDRVLLCSTSEAYGDFSGDRPIAKETDASIFHSPLITPRWSYAAGKILGEHIAIEMDKNVEHTSYIICRYANLFSDKDLGEEEGDKNHLIPHVMLNCFQKVTGQVTFPLVLTEGSDTRRRTMLHSRDAAYGTLIALFFGKGGELYNIGSTEEDMTIVQIAQKVASLVGAGELEIEFKGNRAGDPEFRNLDTTKLQQLGWKPQFSLDDGIKQVWSSFFKLWDTRMSNERGEG